LNATSIYTGGIFLFWSRSKGKNTANLEKNVYIRIIAYFSGALIILIISHQNTDFSMSSSSTPKGGSERFLLGLITFIVLLALLINYIVSQNMVGLPLK
jgi:uncharacterized membrane protein YgdD (TMEM256/DUF423 family)